MQFSPIQEEFMSTDQADPCGSFGPDQRWATVWFFAAIFIGAALTVTLAKTDAYNYLTNGEYFDYDRWGANRRGQTGIGSDTHDPREDGRYETAAKRAASK